jgi:predicted TIM-barrel enzyme
MKRAGVPIIGGGAGTGLSAKCEEAGGIDLIVIYNSAAIAWLAAVRSRAH